MEALWHGFWLVKNQDSSAIAWKDAVLTHIFATVGRHTRISHEDKQFGQKAFDPFAERMHGSPFCFAAQEVALL